MSIDKILSAGTGLLGIGLNTVGINEQMGNQKELMQQQMQNQMALNLQGQKIQQENWDYTNYENQRKHLENAGMNVGLMYGQSGGGGTTMGSQSGGSASGGNAPQNNAPQIMAQMLQSQMLESQIELNKAQANKANAEAEYTGGAQTSQTGANTALIQMNTENAKIQNSLNSRSLEDILDTIKANRDKAVAESSSAITSANVSATTKQSQINEINARALNEAFKMTVAKSGIDVNEAQINKMLEDIKINKFNANTNQEFQGLDKVAGGQLTKLINWFMGATNTNPQYQRKLK